MRDILHEPPAVYEKERATLTQKGWCARLLHLQGKDGLWNRSLYDGKWISTTYSLYLLKTLGLTPGNTQALMGCEQLLAQGIYDGKEIRFSRNKDLADLGVTALVVSLCSYFGQAGDALPQLVEYLIDRQCDEGNWLPNEFPSAADYTFETTLLVLEAFLQYSNLCAGRSDAALSLAVQKGQDFLLGYDLGIVEQKPVKRNWTSFSFPPYWFYDILTALEYFWGFRMNKNHKLEPAIQLVRKKQTQQDVWLLGSRHPGRTYIEMEKSGEPSRWNTLRALRVLDWWDGG
jgi:hypothetical protein